MTSPIQSEVKWMIQKVWLRLLIFLMFCVAFVAAAPTLVATSAYDEQCPPSIAHESYACDAAYGFDGIEMQPAGENRVNLSGPNALLAAFSESLAADSAVPIARITPGSLPASEEASLLQTLGHIDAGTIPTDSIATKWGTQFKNWDGDLPGASGAASPYQEYRVAPPSGTTGAGELRVVANQQTGETYYTWTHYGGSGNPAFVRIR